MAIKILRQGQAPAVAKAQPEPAPKAERAPKVRKAAAIVTPNAVPAVTPNSGKASESRKRGRPRVLSDEQRRERVRQRVASWRAAKAGKAVVAR